LIIYNISTKEHLYCDGENRNGTKNIPTEQKHLYDDEKILAYLLDSEDFPKAHGKLV
jgi:hypothetical protein